MADRIDALSEGVHAVEGRLQGVEGSLQGVEVRVQVVEQKLDLLSVTVKDLSVSVDRRFDAVDAAILEQRQYTEFAFSRLETKMDVGFARFGERFDRLERKLDQFIDLHL